MSKLTDKLNQVDVAKSKGFVTKLKDFLSKEEFSKTKVGSLIVTGLALALVILDAVYELQIIFN